MISFKFYFNEIYLLSKPPNKVYNQTFDFQNIYPQLLYLILLFQLLFIGLSYN